MKALLGEALDEIRASGETADDQANPFGSDLSRVYTALGKYHFLKGEPGEARIVLDIAVRLYENLPTEKRTADDYYRLAQAHALLAKVCPEADKKLINLDYSQRQLIRAVKEKGFRHYHRVARDRAFDDLRAVDGGNWYRLNVVAPIKSTRTSLQTD